MYLPNWKDTLYYIKKDRRNIIYELFVAFILLTGSILYQYGIIPQLPPPPPAPGVTGVEILEKEFRLLATLPGATQQHYVNFHKTNLSSIQGSYRTAASYSALRSFYLEEAKKNGWTFVNEEHLSSDSSEHIMFRKDCTDKVSYRLHTYGFRHELHIYYFLHEGLFTIDLVSHAYMVNEK